MKSRRSSLEGLGLQDLLGLCRRAGEVYLQRLLQIVEHTDPSDRRVLDLLSEMTADATRRVEAVRLYAAHADASSCSGRLNSEEQEKILHRRFPSARKRFGEARLDRDQAMYFSETLQEECRRFYGDLAEQAPSYVSRSFFETQGECCAGSVDHLRSVIL